MTCNMNIYNTRIKYARTNMWSFCYISNLCSSYILLLVTF